MKLKRLIKVLHPDTVVAVVDGDSDIKVVKVSKLDNSLKERQVNMLCTTRGDQSFDLYIDLKS